MGGLSAMESRFLGHKHVGDVTPTYGRADKSVGAAMAAIALDFQAKSIAAMAAPTRITSELLIDCR